MPTDDPMQPESPPAALPRPQDSGTYRRNEDGSLTQLEPPTRIPDTAPVTE